MGIVSFFKSLKESGQAVKGEPVKDKEFFSENEFPDRRTAEREFRRSKRKLFEVDKWSDIPGLTSTFELHDENGKRLADKEVKRDNFVRIVMPGPSPENWVRVTEVGDKDDTAYFVASPATDPTDKQDDKIEHFFVKEATSTFKVELRGNKIIGNETGRNEGANVGEDAGNREVVNTLLSGGGWAGFQRLQWKNLTDYFVHLTEQQNR